MPHLDIAQDVGSREFERPLRRLGLPVRLRHLSCGDFAFWGHGPRDLTRVGVERKTIDELLGEQSYARFTGRQLPRMLIKYPLFRFLVVEGRLKVDPQWGTLMTGRDITTRRGDQMTMWFLAGFGRNPTAYLNFMKRRTTLVLKAGFHVVPTGSPEETAFAIDALYRWFQKPWSAHTSAYALDIHTEVDGALLDDRLWTRDMFAKMPGVGWTRSRRVANYFGSLYDGVVADADDWRKALGFKEGKTTATRIVEYCRKNHRHTAKGA